MGPGYALETFLVKDKIKNINSATIEAREK
jgi:hypothetical protein